MKLVTIKNRRDFLSANTSGMKFVTHSFILQACKRNDTHPVEADSIRFGFTVTKKMGNALVRNRIKRRLREAVRKLPDVGLPGHDYVLISRNTAMTREFSALVRDMEFAFSRIHVNKKPSLTQTRL